MGTSSENPIAGSLLGLDWGQKKVGYATADKLGIVTTPRGTFKRKASVQETWKLLNSDKIQIQKLLEEFESSALVLGLPLNADGSESEAATAARDLAKDLEREFGMTVTLVNEHLSSWDSRGAKDEDAQVAASLLKDYLFSRKSSQGSVMGWFLALLLFISLPAALFVGWKYYAFSARPADPAAQVGSPAEEFIVDVPPGSSFHNVKQQLKTGGLVIDDLSFRAWSKITRAGSRLRVGEFLVKRSWSPLKILTHIHSGPVLQHKLTIREGDNIWDIQNQIQQTQLKEEANEESFQQVIRDPKLLKRMGVPENTFKIDRTLEGFLFPETYTFQKYDNPRSLVEQMLSQYEKRIAPLLNKHTWGNTPEGRYKLLTLASIVEKESGDFNEQPLVASVFWNRLNKKMRLESDPTIIYGFLPDFDGNIKRWQIRHPHPYNTYSIKTLPVGPIANPGEAAVRAVVSPPETNYLFFVSKGDGSHIFSDNYAAHKKNVLEFQIQRRRRR